MASWYIADEPVGSDGACPGEDEMYNPFNMTNVREDEGLFSHQMLNFIFLIYYAKVIKTEIIVPQMNSCSQVRALSCWVGDLTGRHGSISLTKRQLYSDILLQLSGDFTGSKYE